MHAVAILPTVAILAGAALGLALPDFPFRVAVAAWIATLGAVAAAWRGAGGGRVAAALAAAFFAGAVVLTLHAWAAAWRPPLRVQFEAAERAGRYAALIDSANRTRSRQVEEGVGAEIEGTLTADASVGGAAVLLHVDVQAIRGGIPDGWAPTRGGVQLSVGGTLAVEHAGAWRAGRRVRMPVRLRRPTRYLNPGLPDQERSLARRGTTLVGTVKSGAMVEVVAHGHLAAEAAASARAYVRRAVTASVAPWSTRSAAIVTAILIGDRAGLDADVRRRLQDAGTYHVIAISGGNIAILAGLALGAFRLAGLLGRTAMATAILGLLAYAYVVGGGSSVNRATLMAVAFFAARALDLRGAAVNTLAVVAALLISADPLAVADPAFLLTCGATLGILLGVPAWPIGWGGSGDTRAKRWTAAASRSAVALFAASLSAEAMLLPVGAWLFARVTVAGLVLNFAAIPLMAVTQITGMLLIPLFALWPAAGRAMGWGAAIAADGLVQSARLVDVAPALAWRVAPPHWAAIVVYYAGMLAAWWLWRRGVPEAVLQRANRRAVHAATAAIAAGAVVWILFEPRTRLSGAGNGRLQAIFLDVGQGDAAAITFPRGRTLLVDAGGVPGAATFDIGDRVVGPVLRYRGIRQLDLVTLTHGDADHIGGAAALIEEFGTREVWEGVPVPPYEPLRVLRARAERTGARWTTLQAGDATTIDGVQVRVQHPPLPDWERQDVRNDDSIVLELLWRDVSLVLTGDIGREVESAVAAAFEPALIRIVKVPHHGSATSSSQPFIDALKPRIAIVSAGRGNPFGHPVPAVLERYYRAGADVFRTDRDGAVMLDTDGYTVNVRTYTNRTVTVP